MGYFGDFESEEQERWAYEQCMQKQRQSEEPDVVPCFDCGDRMYEESTNPDENICENCKFIRRGKQPDHSELDQDKV